jgi:tetratricopeptide (TPR) repeat protein
MNTLTNILLLLAGIACFVVFIIIVFLIFYYIFTFYYSVKNKDTTNNNPKDFRQEYGSFDWSKLFKKKNKKFPTSTKEMPVSLPDNVKNMRRRAFEKYIVKDYKSAIAIYDRIIELDSENVDALEMRAQSLEILNFNLDAIDDYNKVISIDGSNANVFGLLGLTYKKIGELDKGNYYLQEAVYKGAKLYESIYSFSIGVPEGLKEALIKRGKTSENLQRRSANNFIDDLSEVDEKVYNENFATMLKSKEISDERMKYL